MSLLDRIETLKYYIPTRQEWEYKLQRTKKFPNNPEKWYCNTMGIELALLAESVKKDDIDNPSYDVMRLFYKLLEENFPQYLPGTPGNKFSLFDETASYDDVEKLFTLAIKYANNWAFS